MPASRGWALHQLAVLPNMGDLREILQNRDVVQRAAGHGDHVRVVALRQEPAPGRLPAKALGGGARGRHDGLHGRQPCLLHHELQLLGPVSLPQLRRGAGGQGVRAQGEGDALGLRDPHSVLVARAGGPRLGLQGRRELVDAPHDALDNQQRGHQDGALLLHEVSRGLVHEGAVLDGLATSPECRHDARLAVAVRGHHAVGPLRLLNDRAHLLVAELLVQRVVEL
mmetsp:Transcript_112814/g.364206  ORF Transcript_112814/g.364206 Transcript_112814/m.364206 type:complete len:225 (-) Transcript_112814:684-1358(-)